MKCAFPTCQNEARWTCYFRKSDALAKRGGIAICDSHRAKRDADKERFNPDCTADWCEYDPIGVW